MLSSYKRIRNNRASPQKKGMPFCGILREHVPAWLERSFNHISIPPKTLLSSLIFSQDILNWTIQTLDTIFGKKGWTYQWSNSTLVHTDELLILAAFLLGQPSGPGTCKCQRQKQLLIRCGPLDRITLPKLNESPLKSYQNPIWKDRLPTTPPFC